jgi:hypothetical protein
VFGALFGVCVALQINDPDPIRWMAIYGAAMVASVALPMQRTRAWSRWAAVIVAAGCAAWAAYLVWRIWGKVSLADFVGKMSEKGGAVEEEREAGGLGIAAVWLAIAAALRGRWR